MAALMSVPPPSDGHCECCPDIVGADQLYRDVDSAGGIGWVCRTCCDFAFLLLKRRTIDAWFALSRR
jgi:hypothetical protein